MADHDLSGRSVLVIVTNYGVEQDELLVPAQHLQERGASVEIAASSTERIQTLVGDRKPGATADPTTTLAEVNPASYDLLLVPGGTQNADSLRLVDSAVDIVKSFPAAGKPVAAICHGPWALVEAAVVGGKTLTSYPSLRTDIRNAGGSWVDESVVSDKTGGWVLVTSRTPDDLDDFLRETGNAIT